MDRLSKIERVMSLLYAINVVLPIAIRMAYHLINGLVAGVVEGIVDIQRHWRKAINGTNGEE